MATRTDARHRVPVEVFRRSHRSGSQVNWKAVRAELDDLHIRDYRSWVHLTHRALVRPSPARIRQGLGLSRDELQVWQRPSMMDDRGVAQPFEIHTDEIPAKLNLVKIEREKNAPHGWDTFIRLTPPTNPTIQQADNARRAQREVEEDMRSYRVVTMSTEERAKMSREADEREWIRAANTKRERQKRIRQQAEKEAEKVVEARRLAREARRAAWKWREDLDEEARQAAKALHRERIEKNRALVPKRGES